ncbi:MAG: FAD-binding oxidoreductase [Motiliproteus sp.]
MSNAIRVKKLPKDTGPAGWDAILRPGRSFPELDNTIRADWVVIGAGFAGLAAARRLSQLRGGDKIVLLEAAQLAQGPSGRNSGFMIDLPHELNSETYAGGQEEDLKQIRLNRAAIDFAGEMAEEFGLGSMVFGRHGRVTGAATAKGEKHIQSYCSHLDGLQESYELLDAEAMQALTGIEYYRRGLFTAGAAMIQPAAFVREIAAGLSKQVAIFENSPVIEINTGPVHRISTPKGQVEAPKIILAVNGHIQSFGFLPKRLMHLFTYASMTRALSAHEVKRLGGKPNWGVLPADPMGTTVRRVSDYRGSGDRLTVRNRFTLNQSMEVSPAELQRVIKDHDQAFNARFPMLSGVAMEHRWGGRLCLSLNSVPVFGELEQGIYSAACQNGLGAVKGTLSGMLAAEMAVEGKTPMVSEYLAYDAPKRLPPEPFLSVGANMTLRWKEWRAGIEL